MVFPALVNVVVALMPSNVPTLTSGADCVTEPMASRSSDVAIGASVNVPSIVTFCADGVEVVAPAGTLVKPPMTSVEMPFVISDSSVDPTTSSPDAGAPSRLVLIAENGASSTVPDGAVIVLFVTA